MTWTIRELNPCTQQPGQLRLDLARRALFDKQGICDASIKSKGIGRTDNLIKQEKIEEVVGISLNSLQGRNSISEGQKGKKRASPLKRKGSALREMRKVVAEVEH